MNDKKIRFTRKRFYLLAYAAGESTIYPVGIAYLVLERAGMIRWIGTHGKGFGTQRNGMRPWIITDKGRKLLNDWSQAGNKL